MVLQEWSEAEDDVIARVYADDSLFNKKGAAHAALPDRTESACQQRASYLRRLPNPKVAPARNSPPIARRSAPVPEKAPPEKPPEVMSGRVEKFLASTSSTTRSVRSCDRGDLEVIRKRLEHIALGLSGELKRPYVDILAAIEVLAKEKLAPDPDLRLLSDSRLWD